MNDSELLRQYVEGHSQAAFADLVQRHLNLVYSASLREMFGDTGLAEDVCQAAFTELARKGSKLLDHPSLAGWLYITVRHVSANWRRADQNRRRREQEAQNMNELLSPEDPNQTWQRIRPVLDDALHDLKQTDREAVVLRFLEDLTFPEVGARLGLDANAARMRVDRALEKLRDLLAHRGITSTASTLAAAFAVGVITPAPEAMAASITLTAVASTVSAASTTVGFIKFMSLSKLQASIVGALVLISVALPSWQQVRLQRAQADNAQLRALEADSKGQRTEISALQAELARLRTTDVDKAELNRLRQWQAQTEPELLRLRGMAGVARRANAEAVALKAQLDRQANEAGTNPVSGAMADAMKQAMEQQVEGRLTRMTSSLKLTPEQVQAAREILLKQARTMTTSMQQVFSGKYNQEELTRLSKEGGNPEEQIKALLTPEQKDAYQDYQREEASYNAQMMANTELLQMNTTLGLTQEQQDRAFATLYQVGFNQLTGATKPNSDSADKADQMQWVFEQKAKALEAVLTPTQLDTYRNQQAIQIKLVKDIWAKMQGSNHQ